MMRTGCRASASRRCSPGLCARSKVSQQTIHRQIICRGVVPVGERNGWWLKRPQPNLLDASESSSSTVGIVGHSLKVHVTGTIHNVYFRRAQETQTMPVQVAILQQHPDNLVLVEFFAPWCASCKALYPKLSKLCEANPQIVVVKLNFEENKELAKKFGVKVLPFFHAYHGSLGRVAAFSSSVTKIQRLKDCIEIFGMPYCDLETRDGKVDVAKSLPEFENLPTPDDATVLKFSPDGQYDAAASMDEAEDVPAMEAANAAA